MVEGGFEIGAPLGVKGSGRLTMYSGGPATGMMMGVASMDNIDAWPQMSAATAASATLQDHLPSSAQRLTPVGVTER